ncbi:PKD domain-containing protein [Methanosarcina mazei]|uniref:PKD domain-containing protein n=1 Tax=Methanosarcina mazei TaxID=2209 RepID=UPI00138E2FA0|nr:PKD domain-containing protein [Methanosarcina mazei]
MSISHQTLTNGCVPLVVQFNDTSTESPYAWAWDFENDGIIDSTVKNPVHTYFTKGNYTVTLAVINNAGSNTTTKSNYITTGANVTIQKLAANFSSNVTSGNTPLNVSFTDTSTGVPVKWNWNFGDETANSTFQNPTHTYETAGVYTVTLTVTDTNCNTDSHTCMVTVLEKLESTKVQILSPNITLPGKTFTVNLLVDPSTPIIGTQLDFIFNSSMASADSATEGDLFKQKGASTFFNEGDINSSEGTIKHIYGLIIGTSNVSSPGTFATVNLTAGNKTGMTEFSLSNVLISDINSKSVPYTIANASILIDTAPVIDPTCCPKSVDEESNLAFKISAKDADGDRLTLSASELPQGASFNRTSGAFSWTPAVGQAGVYTITFKVSDGYLTDSENVTVTVNKLNNPPVINFFEPINGSSFSEGERIGISVNATDAEKQALNYSIKIDGVMYSSDPAYIWETDYSSSGNHTIEVSVSDGIDEAKMQHRIYISECHPRWDVNEDGVVNILDITNVSIKYETTVSKPYPRYDINQDGEINILDLTLVGQHLGEKIE